MRHLWVDRIEVVESGVKARGRKAVGSSEDFFDHHFPGNPVFPGVYILEGMAQTAGALVTEASGWTDFALMVSIDRARFSSFARPGEVLDYLVTVDERVDGMTAVRATAVSGDRDVARARITFRVLPMDDMIPDLYAQQWLDSLALLFDPERKTPNDV